MRTKISKWIYGNIGFIAFVSLLAVVYIFNAHKAEGKLRNIQKLKQEVSDAKHHYHEVKNEMMYKSTESQLVEELKTKELKSNDDVPLVLGEG